MQYRSRTYTWAEKFESFERINSIRETNGNIDSCNSCKRLVPSRLHELHEPKFPFVSRIQFIRSKLSYFSAHVYGVTVFFSVAMLTALLPEKNCSLSSTTGVRLRRYGATLTRSTDHWLVWGFTLLRWNEYTAPWSAYLWGTYRYPLLGLTWDTQRGTFGQFPFVLTKVSQ